MAEGCSRRSLSCLQALLHVPDARLVLYGSTYVQNKRRGERHHPTRQRRVLGVWPGKLPTTDRRIQATKVRSAAKHSDRFPAALFCFRACAVTSYSHFPTAYYLWLHTTDQTFQSSNHGRQHGPHTSEELGEASVGGCRSGSAAGKDGIPVGIASESEHAECLGTVSSHLLSLLSCLVKLQSSA